jgi:hypothetical protein
MVFDYYRGDWLVWSGDMAGEVPPLHRTLTGCAKYLNIRTVTITVAGDAYTTKEPHIPIRRYYCLHLMFAASARAVMYLFYGADE